MVCVQQNHADARARGGLIVRKGTETIMCTLPRSAPLRPVYLLRARIRGAVATYDIRVINLAARDDHRRGRQQSLP